jgi:AGZA family xanthine/uracil permease-like MFS transporter
LIDRYFKLTENHTSVKQEMLGGLTTFVTMAYIIVVNPQILAQAGMPPEGVVFATCVSAAAATLAPGMSLNACFTYSVCIAMHVPWRTALAVVFCSGVLFPGAHERRQRTAVRILRSATACGRSHSGGGAAARSGEPVFTDY